jgi:tRNA uridine 5-carbamoylmethylation protein Kti12
VTGLRKKKKYLRKIKNMPLIIMCGTPSSGKTTRAKELEIFFTKEGYNVEVISEESMKINKQKGYGGTQH